MTDKTPGYKHFKDILPNGLTVVTIEMPYIHSTEIAFYVRVGSRYETPDNNGISHFLEHMMFRGSKNYPSSFLINHAFESIGNGLFANTFREFTSFWTKILPEYLENGMEILSDLFHKPLFRDIETERQIILEEILDDLDEDGESLDINNISRSLMFPGDPLGFLVIGSRENVCEIQPRDLTHHFKRFYTPPNMIMCVTGKVTRDQVLEYVNKFFGDLTGKPIPSLPPLQVVQRFPVEHMVQAEGSTQNEIQIAYRALSEGDPDMLKLMLIQRLLDDGISSRMQRGICEKLGLAYDISATIDSFSDAGIFDVDVLVAPNKTARIIEEVLREINDLKTKPVDDEELEKVKERHKREFIFHLDSVRQMSIHFGESELTHAPNMPEEIIKEVDTITAQDIQHLAEKIFCKEHLNVIAIGEISRKDKQAVRRLLKDV